MTETKTTTAFQPVTLDDFVRQDVARKSWAIDGIWPRGSSGVIAAPPKNGKSTLSVELAVSLATGTPMFGIDQFRSNERARVTYVHQGENSTERIRKDFDEILVARGLGTMEEVYDSNPNADESEVIGERFEPRWQAGNASAPHAVPDLELLVNPGMTLGSTGFASSTAVEHRAWLKDYARERDYLILDPIYMLAQISTNDEAAVIDLLTWLSTVRDESTCAIVFTHQSSKHAAREDRMSSIMGSTFIPAWYESAIFPRRDDGGLFTIHLDNLREMGETTELTLQGLGIGRWFYASEAQDVTDSNGNRSHTATKKTVNLERMRLLLDENPDVTDPEISEALGVTSRTVRTYRHELESVES